ncbi:MAG: MBL fold metallo-hydrolase [Patescibacteria group bacterium]
MIIQWLGQSCFKIQTKGNQGENIVVTDPFTDSANLKMSRFQADIVTISCDDDGHNNAEAIRGEPYVIVHPGEYETKDVFIYGVSALAGKNKLTLFKIFSEDISIAHLSGLASTLNEEQIDRLGNVDILLLPVGGGDALEAKKAVEVVSQIDPRLVIPMNYRLDGQKSDLAPIEDFLKASGLRSEKMEKLKVAKKDLMTEETKIIILGV